MNPNLVDAIDAVMGLLYGRSALSRVWRSGELVSINMDYTRRTAYLITNVTSAGFSGGPAINERGRVIGVVSGEPDDRDSTYPSVVHGGTGTDDIGAQQYDKQYSVLTPAWYIPDLLKTNLPTQV